MARSDDDPERSTFFSRLQQAAAPFVGDLVERAIDALPECVCCSGKAIPLRCILCGSCTCKDHGYHSLGRRESICRLCVITTLGAAVGGDDAVELDPWEVLGVAPGSTKPQVERAFRLKAKTCHPDFFPDDLEKAQEFRQAVWAREAILDSLV